VSFFQRPARGRDCAHTQPSAFRATAFLLFSLHLHSYFSGLILVSALHTQLCACNHSMSMELCRLVVLSSSSVGCRRCTLAHLGFWRRASAHHSLIIPGASFFVGPSFRPPHSPVPSTTPHRHQQHEAKQEEEHDNPRAAMMNAPVMVLSKSFPFSPSLPSKKQIEQIRSLPCPPLHHPTHPSLPPSVASTHAFISPAGIHSSKRCQGLSHSQLCGYPSSFTTHPSLPPSLPPSPPSPRRQHQARNRPHRPAGQHCGCQGRG